MEMRQGLQQPTGRVEKGNVWAKFNNQNTVVMRLYNVQLISDGKQLKRCAGTGLTPVKCMCSDGVDEEDSNPNSFKEHADIDQAHKSMCFGLMHESRIFYFQNGNTEDETEAHMQSISDGILNLLTTAKYRILGTTYMIFHLANQGILGLLFLGFVYAIWDDYDDVGSGGKAVYNMWELAVAFSV